jgi:hypothetical protein
MPVTLHAGLNSDIYLVSIFKYPIPQFGGSCALEGRLGQV